PYLLRPFTEPKVDKAGSVAEQQRYRSFNRALSSVRAYVEHAFGLLKGRFHSLKCLGNHTDIQDAHKAIQAMMIIHNLCIDWGDHPIDTSDVDMEDDTDNDEDENSNADGFGDVVINPEMEGVIPAFETDAWHRTKGQEKRMHMLNQLFPV
ncbi:hypothetical protein BDN72DRAFT_781995, partial [Pluteus cervinus]